MNPTLVVREFPASDYDLPATLDSGQAFRWKPCGHAWEGVVGRHWLRLTADPARGVIRAEAIADGLGGVPWELVADYLRVDENLAAVVSAFPKDEPLTRAVNECRGLRLLRQDPWECLASFLLSSTKQIVQIRQIVAALCAGLGEPISVPEGAAPAWAFPSAARIAAVSEARLRDFKMGFRARYLRDTALAVTRGGFDLEAVRDLSLPAARERLVQLPGVGPKIADCVLLFAYGFAEAFPIDVWVMRALRELYFPGRRPRPARLRRFAATYFGGQAGYAQQYLFHAMRVRAGKVASGTRVRQDAPA